MKIVTQVCRFSLALALIAAASVNAATPTTKNGITTIHIDEYNGYFAVKETLAGLKPGKYKFVVTNKANKLVGFHLQEGETHSYLDRFPIEVGQTKTAIVTLNEKGFRYRCPINPTAWIDVDVSK